jgi:hypothetical protein
MCLASGSGFWGRGKLDGERESAGEKPFAAELRRDFQAFSFFSGSGQALKLPRDRFSRTSEGIMTVAHHPKCGFQRFTHALERTSKVASSGAVAYDRAYRDETGAPKGRLSLASATSRPTIST